MAWLQRRNFYDRSYLNAHDHTGDIFVINHAASNAETRPKTGSRRKPCPGTRVNDVPRHQTVIGAVSGFRT